MADTGKVTDWSADAIVHRTEIQQVPLTDILPIMHDKRTTSNSRRHFVDLPCPKNHQIVLNSMKFKYSLSVVCPEHPADKGGETGWVLASDIDSDVNVVPYSSDESSMATSEGVIIPRFPMSCCFDNVGLLIGKDTQPLNTNLYAQEKFGEAPYSTCTWIHDLFLDKPTPVRRILDTSLCGYTMAGKEIAGPRRIRSGSDNQLVEERVIIQGLPHDTCLLGDLSTVEQLRLLPPQCPARLAIDFSENAFRRSLGHGVVAKNAGSDTEPKLLELRFSSDAFLEYTTVQLYPEGVDAQTVWNSKPAEPSPRTRPRVERLRYKSEAVAEDPLESTYISSKSVTKMKTVTYGVQTLPIPAAIGNPPLIKLTFDYNKIVTDEVPAKFVMFVASPNCTVAGNGDPYGLFGVNGSFVNFARPAIHSVKVSNMSEDPNTSHPLYTTFVDGVIESNNPEDGQTMRQMATGQWLVNSSNIQSHWSPFQVMVSDVVTMKTDEDTAKNVFPPASDGNGILEGDIYVIATDPTSYISSSNYGGGQRGLCRFNVTLNAGAVGEGDVLYVIGFYRETIYIDVDKYSVGDVPQYSVNKVRTDIFT